MKHVRMQLIKNSSNFPFKFFIHLFHPWSSWIGLILWKKKCKLIFYHQQLLSSSDHSKKNWILYSIENDVCKLSVFLFVVGPDADFFSFIKMLHFYLKDFCFVCVEFNFSWFNLVLIFFIIIIFFHNWSLISKVSRGT